MTLIVPCIRRVCVEIPRVSRVVRFDFAGSVVPALRQLVAAEEEEPVRVSLVDADGQPVKRGPSTVGRVQNCRLEGRVRDARHDRRGSRLRLVDVVALVLVVAVAAGVRHLEQVIVGEGVLHVAVPLHRIGRAVVGAHGEGCREFRNVVQVRKQRVGVEAEIRPRGLQRVLSIKRRDEPGELQFVQVEIVVIDAEATPQHRLVIGAEDESDTRPEVVEILFQDPLGKKIVLVDDQRNQLRRQIGRYHVVRDLAARRIERAFLVVLLVPRSKVLPPQPDLQREDRRNLPVVVDERCEGRRRVIRA